jgi:hypothetical protein
MFKASRDMGVLTAEARQVMWLRFMRLAGVAHQGRSFPWAKRPPPKSIEEPYRGKVWLYKVRRQDTAGQACNPGGKNFGGGVGKAIGAVNQE